MKAMLIPTTSTPSCKTSLLMSALKSFRRRLIRKKNARTDLTENEESDSEEDEDNYEDLLDI